MAAITICSDFGAQKNNVCHGFHCFPRLIDQWNRKQNSEVKWSEVKSLSRVRLFATPWTVAYQALPSMGFSRQEYWSGFAISFSRGSSRHRNRTRSPTFQADASTSEPHCCIANPLMTETKHWKTLCFPFPQALATTILLFTFMSLITLDKSYKWTQVAYSYFLLSHDNQYLTHIDCIVLPSRVCSTVFLASCVLNYRQ